MGDDRGGWSVVGDLGKVFHLLPLGHELVGFVKPFRNGFGGVIHGIDPLHQFDGDPSREIPD